MEKVRELLCEINHMHDSKDFMDAESMYSGQLSHVPNESALFRHQDERGDLLARAKITPPDFWNTSFTSGNVFSSPPVDPSQSHERMSSPWDHPDAGKFSETICTGQPVAEDGDEGKSAIPNPRRNSFDPMKGRNSTNCGVDQQRLQISEPHFDKFPTPQTFSCWKTMFKTEVCSCSCSAGVNSLLRCSSSISIGPSSGVSESLRKWVKYGSVKIWMTSVPGVCPVDTLRRSQWISSSANEIQLN